MLAAGISAAALAGGSYLIVRHNLLSDSLHTDVRQARRNLAIAPTYLREGPDALRKAYERTGDFLTVGVVRGLPFSSTFSVGLRQVPADLRQIVRRGELGYQRETVAGTHYLVVGGPAGKGAELYFFFTEQTLRHELAQLRTILLADVGLCPRIDATVFSQALKSIYWTSETVSSDHAWGIDFCDGMDHSAGQDGPQAVRCVRTASP